MIWIEHDLMDPRTTIRDKANEYMHTVMRAELVNPGTVRLRSQNGRYRVLTMELYSYIIESVRGAGGQPTLLPGL